jgi:hypothetical protein
MYICYLKLFYIFLFAITVLSKGNSSHYIDGEVAGYLLFVGSLSYSLFKSYNPGPTLLSIVRNIYASK